MRRGPGATARSCSSGWRSPCSMTTSMPAAAATPAHAACALRISAAPGRNVSTSPSSPSATSLRSAAATSLSSGRSAAPPAAPRYSIVTSNRRPSARSDGQPRKPAIGSASSVADITTSCSSFRRCLQPTQQRQRHVALQMPLVKLVEQHRAHAAAAPDPTANGASARLRSRTPRACAPTPRRRSARDSRFARRPARPAPPPPAAPPCAPPAAAARGRGSRPRRRRRAAHAGRASSCPRPAALPTPALGVRCSDATMSGMSGSIGSGTSAVRAEGDTEATSASRAPRRSAAYAASSPPSVATASPAASRGAIVVPLRMLHRHGHVSFSCPFRSVSAAAVTSTVNSRTPGTRVQAP